MIDHVNRIDPNLPQRQSPRPKPSPRRKEDEDREAEGERRPGGEAHRGKSLLLDVTG